MDNLSAHTGTDLRRWAKKNKVELCFTPTYASWANPIEAHFGPLRQFTLANSNHPNHTVQTRALHAYLRWRNANARHPDILAAQRKERARIRSEKGILWAADHYRQRPDDPTPPQHYELATSARTRASSRGRVAIGQWPESRSTYSRWVVRARSGLSSAAIHSLAWAGVNSGQTTTTGTSKRRSSVRRTTPRATASGQA